MDICLGLDIIPSTPESNKRPLHCQNRNGDSSVPKVIKSFSCFIIAGLTFERQIQFQQPLSLSSRQDLSKLSMFIIGISLAGKYIQKYWQNWDDLKCEACLRQTCSDDGRDWASFHKGLSSSSSLFRLFCKWGKNIQQFWWWYLQSDGAGFGEIWKGSVDELLISFIFCLPVFFTSWLKDFPSPSTL